MWRLRLMPETDEPIDTFFQLMAKSQFCHELAHSRSDSNQRSLTPSAQ